MVRRTDRPLRIVRVSFEATRFGAQHLIEAYSALVPMVRRRRVRGLETDGSPEIKAIGRKRRRGEA